MQPQTFQAREIKEALALVRRELGPDAIIMETRRVPGRALGLLGGSLIEITAQAPDSAEASNIEQSSRGGAEQKSSERETVISAANRHKALLALSRARRRQESPQASTPLSQRITDRPHEAIATAIGSRIAPGLAHSHLRKRLLAAMIPRDVAESWLSKLDPNADAVTSERQLVGFIQRILGRPAALHQANARVVAMIGPTGVGKTTTIAKLAAQAKLVEQRSVALVSLDDARIGATAQLRAYAELLSVPFYACSSSDNLAQVLAAECNTELIFVDTPGAAPQNLEDINKLNKRLRRAGEPISTHLCVAAATRQEELERILHVYKPFEPHALVSTKLDEAVVVGSMFVARLVSDIPFSYVTTGQQIPDDISPAAPSLLTSALLGGAPK